MNERERLAIHDNVLCRRWTSVDGLHTRWQVILPYAFRSEFIKLAHSGMSGGHIGRLKTEEQVRLRAYWPNWMSQVRLELKRCAPCAQYHRRNAPRQFSLYPILAGEPFETVLIDITGRHLHFRAMNISSQSRFYSASGAKRTPYVLTLRL